METREQKIERLKAKIKKEKWWYNQWNKTALSFVSGCMKCQIKQTIVKLEQELKELEKIQETKELLEKVKAENMASDKQCVKCVCYVAKYTDDYTLRHFGYGEVKIRPACSFAGTYGYVSHNPARLCRWYKENNK